MEIFQYQVITKTSENVVSITFVDPVYPALPIFFVAGLFLSIYGFYQSRSLLASNRRKVALVLGVGAALTALSLSSAVVPNTPGTSSYQFTICSNKSS
jgi:hypothetical protein